MRPSGRLVAQFCVGVAVLGMFRCNSSMKGYMVAMEYPTLAERRWKYGHLKSFQRRASSRQRDFGVMDVWEFASGKGERTTKKGDASPLYWVEDQR